eukprot:scaffold41937_cov58-Attheya_sp.AAC.1
MAASTIIVVSTSRMIRNKSCRFRGRFLPQQRCDGIILMPATIVSYRIDIGSIQARFESFAVFIGEPFLRWRTCNPAQTDRRAWVKKCQKISRALITVWERIELVLKVGGNWSMFHQICSDPSHLCSAFGTVALKRTLILAPIEHDRDAILFEVETKKALRSCPKWMPFQVQSLSLTAIPLSNSKMCHLLKNCRQSHVPKVLENAGVPLAREVDFHIRYHCKRFHPNRGMFLGLSPSWRRV